MKQVLRALLVLAVLTGAQPVAGAAVGAKSVRRIAISVTGKGFEPSSIHVKAGRPVVLVVTRKTDETCATEIVIASQNLRRALPLNKPVEILVSAKKPGTLRYVCGMGMASGTLVID